EYLVGLVEADVEVQLAVAVEVAEGGAVIDLVLAEVHAGVGEYPLVVAHQAVGPVAGDEQVLVAVVVVVGHGEAAHVGDAAEAGGGGAVGEVAVGALAAGAHGGL